MHYEDAKVSDRKLIDGKLLLTQVHDNIPITIHTLGKPTAQ